MKQIFKILLFILIPILGRAQNNKTIEITYIKAYKNYRDTSNTTPKLLKNLEYKLICNTDKARFEYIKNMVNDGDKANRHFISKGGGKGVYYKSLINNEKLHQIASLVDDNIYIVKLPFNEYKWTITNETKKIGTYVCYKAFTEYDIKIPDRTGKPMVNKNKVIVWFSPKLSYPFGPAGFDGLPGIVLEKSSNSFYFIASKIVFKDMVNKIEKPTKGIKIKKIEYENYLKNQIKKYN